MPVTLKEKLPITAIEIDDNFMKLCQMRERKGKKIIKLSISRLNTSQPTVAEIKRIMKQSKINTNFLIIVVPREQVIVRFLKLPSKDDSEISQMLEFQLRQQVPYPKEDIVRDYIILDTFSDGSSLAMFTAARKETVYKYTSLFEDLRFRPRLVTLSSLGVVNWYNCVAGKEPQQPVLLLDIDYNYVEAILVQNGNFLFTRSISISDDKDLFIGELARTIIQGIQKEDMAGSLSKIVITGGVDKFADLDALLQDKFSIPVERIPCARNFILEDAKEYDKYRQENISLTSVIGITSAKNKTLVNLIPAEAANKWESKDKRMQLFRSLVIIGGIFILLATAHIKQMYDTSAYGRYLDSRIRKTQDEVRQLEDMTKRLEFIRQELNKREVLPNIISALYTITPSSVRLLDFAYEEGDKVSLRGNGGSMRDVFELSNKLDKQPYFKGVKIKYVSEKRLQGTESRVDFELLCLLN